MSISTGRHPYPLGYMMVAGQSTNLIMITTNQANAIVLNRLAAVGVTDPHDGLIELRHAILGDAPLF